MIWGVNLEDLAAARDELLVEVRERPGSHALERLARAHRWLGEEDEARPRFRDAAEAAEGAFGRWEREDPSAIGRIGSLLLRAGDGPAAAPGLERAARSQPRTDDAAALAYLRGDFEGAKESARSAASEKTARSAGADAGAYPWAEAVALLAGARRDGDAERAAAAGRVFAALIRDERTPPDEESGSASFSLFEWLEECARVQAKLGGGAPPDHEDLLARSGLLRAERAPAAPDAGPTQSRTATIAYPGLGGGELTPSVTVDERGDIHFVLDPERGLRASLVQDDGAWRAQLGDSELPGSFRGPRGAKRAIWDPLRDQSDGQWAVALLDKLCRESFRL